MDVLLGPLHGTTGSSDLFAEEQTRFREAWIRARGATAAAEAEELFTTRRRVLEDAAAQWFSGALEDEAGRRVLKWSAVKNREFSPLVREAVRILLQDTRLVTWHSKEREDDGLQQSIAWKRLSDRGLRLVFMHGSLRNYLAACQTIRFAAAEPESGLRIAWRWLTTSPKPPIPQWLLEKWDDHHWQGVLTSAFGIVHGRATIAGTPHRWATATWARDTATRLVSGVAALETTPRSELLAAGRMLVGGVEIEGSVRYRILDVLQRDRVRGRRDDEVLDVLGRLVELSWRYTLADEAWEGQDTDEAIRLLRMLGASDQLQMLAAGYRAAQSREGNPRQLSPEHRQRAADALMELGHMEEALALVEGIGGGRLSAARLRVARRFCLLGKSDKEVELLRAVFADSNVASSLRDEARQQLAKYETRVDPRQSSQFSENQR